jgi:acarbose 7IV-phosphotransferase
VVGEILVCGNINVETSLKVDSFPIAYEPVRYTPFQLNCDLSGVGFNIAFALTKLGDRVRLCSMLGHDLSSEIVKAGLASARLTTNSSFKS